MSLENHDQIAISTAGVDRTWRCSWPGPRAFTCDVAIAMCWLSPPLVCLVREYCKEVEALPGGDLNSDII